MQIGIDSFAAAYLDESRAEDPADRVRELVEQIEYADQVGLDVFGIGEHHRKDYLDSAPAIILAAAAARTQRIRLTSAVAVLSAVDPVRLFQEFATLDLLSRGRAEMVVGRGSSIEAFPLFGFRLEDYDALFAEKLELLLRIRENEHVQWSGKFRPALTGQGIYPRPLQNPFPIWLGVGATPNSFVRAGSLGLPLMVAIIGGQPEMFRHLVDLYRAAGKQAGQPTERLKVGVHALGYVAVTNAQAADDFYPGFAKAIDSVAKERGLASLTRTRFDAQRGPEGALMIGTADEVAEKIMRYHEVLGGISRITFQMNASSLPHTKLMRAIEAIGTRVAPLVRAAVAMLIVLVSLLPRTMGAQTGEPLFQPLLADPREPAFFAAYLWGRSPHLGSRLGVVGLGQTIALYRARHWELAIEAGVFSQFDMTSRTNDLINADYRVGLPLAYRRGAFAGRLRLYHQSSHLGDEYLLHTGAKRENLTFESAELIVSRGAGPWRLYGGGEYVLVRSPSSLKPGVFRAGLEYRGRVPATPHAWVRFVGGVDVISVQVRAWRTAWSAIAGIELGMPRSPWRWSVLLKGYAGPAPYGQFYMDQLTSVGAGVSFSR